MKTLNAGSGKKQHLNTACGRVPCLIIILLGKAVENNGSGDALSRFSALLPIQLLFFGKNSEDVENGS